MRIELPQLPYAASALEPWISARTVNTHHGKHHRAYVDKVKALVGDSAETLEAVILRSAGDATRQVLFNNAAQAWNHAFYWQNRGQAWVAKRIAEAVPRISEPGARTALRAMHESHVANIDLGERVFG